jgi:hypothetical protein
MASILDQLTKDEFTEMMDNVNASQLRVLLEAERKNNAELMAQVKKEQHTVYALKAMINRYADEIRRCERKEAWPDNHPLVEINTMTPTQYQAKGGE